MPNLFCDNVSCIRRLADARSWVVCRGCEKAVYCSDACRMQALECGHRENCPKLVHIRDYTRIAQEHMQSWTEVETLFAARNYVGFLTHTARIQEIADFCLVTSAIEHNDINTQNAIIMFSRLGECNNWLLHMDLALRFFEFAYKIQASVPADSEHECNRMPVMENLARTYRRLGRPQDAIKLYMKCIQLRPEGARMSWYYGHMARCTMEKGLFQSALKWVDKAEQILAALASGGIEDHDKLEQTNLHLDIKAQCCFALGEYDGAVLFCVERVLQIRQHGERRSIDFVKANVMLARALTHSSSPRLERCESILGLLLTICIPTLAQQEDELRDRAKIQSLRCDVLLHLSFVLYKLNKTQEALAMLRTMLQEYLVHQSSLCGYCKQNKNNTTTRMPQCGGCRVVRFCNREHQEMASARLAMQNGRMLVKHSRLCRLLHTYRRKSISAISGDTDAESEEAQLIFLRTGLVAPSP